MKTLKKDEDIEINLKDDDFKVFIRVKRGTPKIHLVALTGVLRSEKNKIVFIPENFEVLVIRKDGSVEKF